MCASTWGWIIPDMATDHANPAMAPSPWVRQCVESLQGSVAVKPGLRALDLACGGGRHALYLASLGYVVHAVDKNTPDTVWPANVQFQAMDLEQADWPLAGQQYDLIVVTNYLHRPHFENLLGNLKSQNAVLVYETFMDGNAQFGSPRSPDFLLQPNELLSRMSLLNILRFEQGLRSMPSPAMIQRAMGITGTWSEIQSGTITLTQRD
ncbi:methyltransferase domain-containing protein [Limnobacter sp. SAORIC-580]|jgi:SAM-dependent methyltransferase|uniref:Methyltransferase domain-containing protein n=2 Tax=Burkholderiaceae TaxID=119060 RepID=A0ABX6N4H0_9BURK|nr:methyltransferase domain-containing protein [Limnobacter sp. SAORIC-580]